MNENNSGALDRALMLCSSILESNNPEGDLGGDNNARRDISGETNVGDGISAQLDTGKIKETKNNLVSMDVHTDNNTTDGSANTDGTGDESRQLDGTLNTPSIGNGSSWLDETVNPPNTDNESIQLDETVNAPTTRNESIQLDGTMYTPTTGNESIPLDETVNTSTTGNESIQLDGTINMPSTDNESSQLLRELASSRTELEAMRKRLSTAERKLDKADGYNEVLRKMVESLSAQIHAYKRKPCCTDAGVQVEVAQFCRDTHIQVDEADLLQYTTGKLVMPDWGSLETQVQVSSSESQEITAMDDSNPEVSSMSIAESLKATAEAVVAEQEGFTLDAASGLYYDHNTGYYYDPNSQLYYDPTNCMYFYFDHESGKYTFHSQVSEDPNPSKSVASDKAKKAKVKSAGKPSKSKKEKKVDRKKNPTADVGIEREPVTEKDFKNRKERREALRKEIEELTKMKERLQRKHRKRTHSERRHKRHKSPSEDNRHRKHKHRKRKSESNEGSSRHSKHRKQVGAETREKKEKRKIKDFDEIINLESDESEKSVMRREDADVYVVSVCVDGGARPERVGGPVLSEVVDLVTVNDHSNLSSDGAGEALTNTAHNVIVIDEHVLGSNVEMIDKQLEGQINVDLDAVSDDENTCIINENSAAHTKLLNKELIIDELKTEHSYLSKDIEMGNIGSGTEDEVNACQLKTADRLTQETIDIDGNTDGEEAQSVNQLLPVNDGTGDSIDDEEVLRNILRAKMAEYMDMQQQSDDVYDSKLMCDKVNGRDNNETASDLSDGLYCDIDEPGKCDFRNNNCRKHADRGESHDSRKEKKSSRSRRSPSKGRIEKRKHLTRRVSGSLSDAESGEISSSESGELSDISDCGDESDSSVSSEPDSDDLMDDIATGALEGQEEEPEMDKPDELSNSWPPCIRLMVVGAETMDVGTLFIITCDGGTVGRTTDTNHAVWLNEPNVSKMHAEIRFVREVGHYKVNDLGSQNGTFLNGRRVVQRDDIASCLSLSHGDVLDFGGTRLLCHIHPGANTCDDCEPGVVRAKHIAQQPQQGSYQILSKSEKKSLQRKELKQIKHKYGLKDSAYVDNHDAINNPRYTDKAEERRRVVGSDTPHQKHEAPASVHRPLSSGNIGHKMLKKMGWTEGESLGKDNTGIQEPVTVGLRANQSAGLGSAMTTTFSADDANSVDMRKVGRRLQAQQRYKQLQAGMAGGDAANTGKSAAVNKPWQKGDTIHPD